MVDYTMFHVLYITNKAMIQGHNPVQKKVYTPIKVSSLGSISELTLLFSGPGGGGKKGGGKKGGGKKR